MSRRPPSDAFTRFTSNNSHAAQKPTSFAYPLPKASASAAGPRPSPGGNGETPKEKVARLRALARSQKEGQLSGVDKAISGGRRWADVAHRVTTYTLLGLTGISAVVGVYSLFSLITHSRRQKRAFIDREMGRLQDAQQAFLRGDASAEQLHLLEQERAGEDLIAKAAAEKSQKKSEGVWARLKGAVGQGAAAGDLGTETQKEAEARESRRGGKGRLLEEAWAETELRPVAVTPSGIEGVGYDEKGRPVPANKMQRVARKVGKQRRTGEDEVKARTGIQAGPLDVLASNVASNVTPSNSSNSWLSWVRGSG